MPYTGVAACIDCSQTCLFVTRVKGFKYGMNWHFRLRNRPLPPSPDQDNCAHIRPLLSLMSDGMASAKEAREAEAHLQTCGDCRQALLWINATRQAIVARPVVLPPADMRARIACAIAASAETAVPAVPIAMPSVRRVFTLRPAYAAAASVAVAGAFLGHYLLTSGRAPGTEKPILPIRSASSGQGKTNAAPSAKTGHAVVPTLPGSRRQPLVAVLAPSGESARQTTANSSPARQTHPLFASGRTLSAGVPRTPTSPGPDIKTPVLQVASGPRRLAPPAPAAAERHPDLLAVRPAPKSPPGVRTHAPGDRPQLATLPASSAETHAAPAPFAVTSPPAPAPAPVQAPVVARLPDTSPAPPRAPSGDGLGSVRTSVASYSHEGYARRLSMANGVHLRQNFVQISAVWTPTSLSQTTATRRTAVAAFRPASAQAAPQTATITPVSELTSSNQRRSERDKQWSDTPTSGGA